MLNNRIVRKQILEAFKVFCCWKMLFTVSYLIGCVHLNFTLAEKLSEAFCANFNY